MSVHGFLQDAQGKWQQKRIEFGGNGWVGKPPLYELYEELLDAINYLDEYERQEGRVSKISQTVRNLLLTAGHHVRRELERC